MKMGNETFKKVLKSCVVLGISILAILINSKALESKASFKVAEKEYLILAYNDLGMHCIQGDYSAFMILPPANTVRVQVFEKGTDKAKLIDSGIILEYKMNNNTTSVDKSNFWNYAEDYGYDLKPNEGITGNYLSGVCKLSKDKNYYEAEYVPVVPFNDGSKERNPYQTMTVTVIDEATKKVLAQEDSIVVPVSDEMNCSNCHGEVDTYANILKVHDRKEKTTLYSCHNSPHAEWISSLPQDNEIPKKLYGKPDFIRKCTTCHENKGNNKIHQYKGE